jgi:hypothetical protein
MNQAFTAPLIISFYIHPAKSSISNLSRFLSLTNNKFLHPSSLSQLSQTSYSIVEYSSSVNCHKSQLSQLSQTSYSIVEYSSSVNCHKSQLSQDKIKRSHSLLIIKTHRCHKVTNTLYLSQNCHKRISSLYLVNCHKSQLSQNPLYVSSSHCHKVTTVTNLFFFIASSLLTVTKSQLSQTSPITFSNLPPINACYVYTVSS